MSGDDAGAIPAWVSRPPEPDGDEEAIVQVKAPEPETKELPGASDPEMILWHSNAPWVGSGYGTQSALFAPRIQRDLGHPVAFSAFYGLKGKRLGWVDPVTNLPFQVYPGHRDNHGNDCVVAHYKHYTQGRPGFCVLLSDVWVMRSQVPKSIPMLAWCPVDHDPCIPQTIKWFEEGGAFPIAMSKFGRDKMIEGGLKNVQYVPHGFDPDMFKPAERWEARRALGLPEDAFIVAMVAANLGAPSRKSFGQAIKAFSIFQKKNTDAVLYMHTMMQDPLGENLPAICEACGVIPYTADPYLLTLGLPHQTVCAVHNAASVLLNPAMGEGFGVPLIEAQACGTPCIVTDFSAMPEVAPQTAGNWHVGGQKVWTGFESWQVTPDIEQIVVALQQAYDESKEDQDLRRRSVFEHAKWYSADHVVDTFWKPALSAARAEFILRRKKMHKF